MRKCRACKTPYEPRNSLQKACSILCAMALAKVDRERAERKERQEDRKALRAAKDRIKTRSQWMREAQAAFNQFIRERDHDLPCISCGRHHQGQYHAGHYRSTGACPEARFDEMNCHKQCAPCNSHLSGNLIEYRIGLVRRYGADLVEYLEGPHEPKKYTIDELRAIKAEYTAKAKELKNKRERDAA